MPAERAAAAARLRADVAGEGVREADVVIEAIFEDLEAKHALFRKRRAAAQARGAAGHQHLQPHARVARRGAGAARAPGRAALLQPGGADAAGGGHSFGAAPRRRSLAAALAFARTPGQAAAAVPQLAGLPGQSRARALPAGGADRAGAGYRAGADRRGSAKDFGMPMGPIELADVVGLDVCKHVGDIVGQLTGRAPPLPLTRIEERIAAAQARSQERRGFLRLEGRQAAARRRGCRRPAAGPSGPPDPCAGQ